MAVALPALNLIAEPGRRRATLDTARGHCQLKPPWYALRVGGAAARVGRSFARLLCCPL